MSEWKIYLKDGTEKRVKSDCAPWWNYDVDLRETVLQFGTDAQFRENLVIGFAKVQL